MSTTWGSPVEIERRNRILICLAALAYEEYSDPIMDDATFDALALKIDTSMDTGNPQMDEWFRQEFSPATGSWIGAHPNLPRLRIILEKCYLKKKKEESTNVKQLPTNTVSELHL